MEIGRLMSAYDDAIRAGYAKSQGAATVQDYEQQVKKFVNDYVIGRKSGINDYKGHKAEKLTMMRMLAAGYGDQLSSEFKNLSETETNPEHKKEMIRAYTGIKRLMARRDALINDKYSEEFDRIQNSNKSTKEVEQATKYEEYRKHMVLYALICIAVTIFVALIFGPAIVNSVKQAGQALMNGDLSITDKLVSILKAVIGIAVIAVPLSFGIYFIYCIIDADNTNKETKEATVKVADMTGPVFMNTIDKIVKDLNDPSLA